MVGASKELDSTKTLAAKSPEVDFAIVLSRVIGSVNDDPAQLRNVVYELARAKLQRELSQRNPVTNHSETRHLTLYQSSQLVTDDRPFAMGDGHDFPWLIDECVPSIAAVVDDVVEGFEDAV